MGRYCIIHASGSNFPWPGKQTYVLAMTRSGCTKNNQVYINFDV